MSVQAQPKDYAKAIYDLALEVWTSQLGDVQRALSRDPDLRAVLGDPGVEVSTRLQRLDEVVSGGLNDRVRKFLGTLLEGGNLDQLDAILVELERLVRRRPERRLAKVTSAIPLTQAEEEKLRERLLDRFGTDLEFEFAVDASLIGGIRLRVGDRVIDGTVAGKLEALRDHLAA